MGHAPSEVDSERAARLAKVEELRELLRRQTHGAAPLPSIAPDEGDAEHTPDSTGLQAARGAITVISGARGSGKTTLALSRLAEVTRAGQRAALVDGTGWFYPPAFMLMDGDLQKLMIIQPTEDREVWATEQVLRSGLFAIVVLLEPARVDGAELRRLQLAAERGRAACVLVPRDAKAVPHGLVSLRLHVTAVPPEAKTPMPIAAPSRRVEVRTLHRRGVGVDQATSSAVAEQDDDAARLHESRAGG